MALGVLERLSLGTWVPAQGKMGIPALGQDMEVHVFKAPLGVCVMRKSGCGVPKARGPAPFPGHQHEPPGSSGPRVMGKPRTNEVDLVHGELELDLQIFREVKNVCWLVSE